MLGSVARSVFGAFGLEVVRKSTHRGISLQSDLAHLIGPTPDTIIDAGANIGQFSRNLVSWFPNSRIFAFEPIPQTFEILRATMSERVRPVCAALGETSGTAHMTVGEHSVHNRITESNSGREIAVSMKSLDDFCRESNIDHIALLKTDCEGYDANVIKGAAGLLKAQSIDAVYCEINFTRDGQYGDFFAIHEQLHPQFLFYGLYEYSSRAGPDFANGLWVRR